MDVYVWVNSDDQIVCYQITYDKPNAEKALTWKIESGFSHHGVDDDAKPGKHPGTPLLITDGLPNLPRLMYLIYKNFGDVAPEVKKFIVTKLVHEFRE